MKTITEHFEIKLFANSAPQAESCCCFITARNDTKHEMGLSNNPIRLTTADIREIANFLNETANKMETDKDFKQT